MIEGELKNKPPEPFGSGIGARTTYSSTYWRRVTLSKEDYAVAAEFFCGPERAKTMEPGDAVYFRYRRDVEHFCRLMAAITGRDCATPAVQRSGQEDDRDDKDT